MNKDPNKTFYPSKPNSLNRKPNLPLQLKPTDTCILCNTNHEMSKCLKFKDLSLEQKRLIVRNSVLCFHCLSSKHFLRDCKVQEGKMCGIGGCKLYHHSLLHSERPQFHVEYDRVQYAPLNEEEENAIAHLFEEGPGRMMHLARKGAISLQTLVCNVAIKGKNLRTVALLDTGSTMTVIDEDFAKKHQFPIIDQREGQEVYMVDRLVKMEGIQYLVELTISSSENDRVSRVEAWTVKNLVHDCGIVDWSERKKAFPHLKDINFPKLPVNPKITILFGINTTRMFHSTQTVHNPENENDPVAMKTFLGWTCVGRSDNPKQLSIDPTSQLNKVLFSAHSPK